MPQLVSDDAAHDEPKTYNDEKGLENWDQDRLDLENVKGDLVQQGDPQDTDQSYNNNKGTSGNTSDSNQLQKNSDREASGVGTSNERCLDGIPGITYTSDINSLIHTNFQQPFLPPVVSAVSAQVGYPYSYPQPFSLLYNTATASDLEAKAASISRAGEISSTAMYSLPGQLGQIPHPLSSWAPAGFPYCSAATMASILRPHHFGMTSAASHFPMMPGPQPGSMHPTLLPHPSGLQLTGPLTNGHQPGSSKAEKLMNSHVDNPATGSSALHHHNNHLLHAHHNGLSNKRKKSPEEKRGRPYVKKPLNAFMLYMKEQRSKVVAECTLKESAAINQILGRKWHNLSREEQQKYYDMARRERQIHMEKFPGWSARDNYGKRKKRKKEKTQDCTAQNPKKCRAVFGLEQQHLWCPPCRRKKKCVRYKADGDESDGEESDSSPIPNFQGNSPNSLQHFDAASPHDSPAGRDVIKRECSPNNDETATPSGENVFHNSNNSNNIQPNNQKRQTEASVTSSSFHNDRLTGETLSSTSHRRNDVTTFPSTSSSNVASLFPSSMLSPTGTCPGVTATPAFFSPCFQPYLQMNSFAAAATSPAALSGLMNLHNFKAGLAAAAPMGIGLNSAPSAANGTSLPGGAAANSRITTSALEGKS